MKSKVKRVWTRRSRKLTGGIRVELTARLWTEGKEACRVENVGWGALITPSNSTFCLALGASQEFSRQALIYASLYFSQIWQSVQNIDILYNINPTPPTQCIS